MTLQEERLLNLYNQAADIVESLGIEIGTISELQVNTRAKNRWGQCKYNAKNDTYLISVSSQLLDENIPDEKVMDTLVHELLHTCEGCLNHGEKWKKLANLINQNYDLNIKRVTSAEEKGVPRVRKEPKYFIKCPECGHIYTRRKRSYVVNFPEKCGCTHCGHWGLELL